MCSLSSSLHWPKKWLHKVLLTTLMEQQTVTILLYPWLVCHDIKSAMHCSLRLAPTMINHLTSVCIQLSAIAFKCEIAWTEWTITNPIYRIVPSKHPWALAAQVSNLRVAVTRMRLNGSTIPIQGPTPDAKLAATGLNGLLHRQFVCDSSRPARQWRRLYCAIKQTDL